MLLEKHSTLLEAVQESTAGRQGRSLAALTIAKGIVFLRMMIMTAAAAYAVTAVVEEELELHFGSSRVVLVFMQVMFGPCGSIFSAVCDKMEWNSFQRPSVVMFTTSCSPILHDICFQRKRWLI